MRTVAVVGGGAAGLAAAVAAARAGARTTVYEANDRVGKTILATGNGRCNFSNERPLPEAYRNAAFVDETLRSFGRAYRRGFGPAADGAPHEIADFFRRLGLCARSEEGRMYPLTNKATTVVDVLRAASASWGVEERCGMRAVALEPAKKGRWRLAFDDGSAVVVDAVIAACGGRIARGLLPGGHPFVRQHAVLGPLRTDTARLKGLNNVRARCAVSVRDEAGRLLMAEEGEVLFRDYGVSGIVVFNASRFAHAGCRLAFDFLPALSGAAFDRWCEERWEAMTSSRGAAAGALTALDYLNGIMVPALARNVLKAGGVDPVSPLDRPGVSAVACALKAFSVTVDGVADPRQCQVTRGGLAIEGFDPSTLASRTLDGLYAAGEALDVDGPCGGYNLHWAWASGLLAGMCAASGRTHG